MQIIIIICTLYGLSLCPLSVDLLFSQSDYLLNDSCHVSRSNSCNFHIIFLDETRAFYWLVSILSAEINLVLFISCITCYTIKISLSTRIDLPHTSSNH